LRAEQLELLGRVGFRLVHVGGERGDPVARDRAHEVPHPALLVGQVKIVAHFRFRGSTALSATPQGADNSRHTGDEFL